VLCQKRREKCG
ncbi:Ribose import ATP-binding protein RbsA, partial [Haemophilus influenzae]